MSNFIHRHMQPPINSAFIFGPRGTGKSMYLRHHFPEAHYINLLEDHVLQMHKAHPDFLISTVEANPEFKVIIIDEVQRAIELLPVVHHLIEKRKDVQFIMTGSSARKLKHDEINLLGGRAVQYFMFPFMASELGEAFDIEFAMQYGMLPMVTQSKTPEKTMDTYTSLYILQEVFQESLTRNTGNFNKFLEKISFSHGHQLNYSNVARESFVGRKTVESYVEILEDILLSFRLDVFTRRAKRQLAVTPKFYYFDSGVFRSIRPKGPLDTPQEIGGSTLEGLVAQHLLAWASYSRGRHKVYFWRSKGGVEVDFILYGPMGLFAFEIKNSTRVRRKELRGLFEFGKDYDIAQKVFIYRGKEQYLEDGILFMPAERFLKGLVPDQLPIPAGIFDR